MLIVWNVNSSHCEYKASRGVDYQSMPPLQCIVFSGSICSQHAIEMDLVSQKAPKNPDSNDLSPISVSLKTKKVIQVFFTPNSTLTDYRNIAGY